MLEITCKNPECGCECLIGQSQHQNLIFESDLEIDKKFTCDECESVIFEVDKNGFMREVL